MVHWGFNDLKTSLNNTYFIFTDYLKLEPSDTWNLLLIRQETVKVQQLRKFFNHTQR